ncbi:hydantoinase B/oxoprolinase family protein [Calycomorphotria hydatis]|uniref:Acetophenone carboxylase gamma subunit n=1 Tax=Calycomorphotria hydatis TaxID=2528027 RepID=A0A517TAP7_9PLAN|nr:hydantoinase B/oxoprolinase family protein [Calycomorphotria hydatis]QDT65445.1 Acetophenone carboxylase gamma subunit [Calycomorphotria hydatis]
MRHDWQFWIDVGGTFTDCLAVKAGQEPLLIKVLSSGVTKGVVKDAVDATSFEDERRIGEPDEFWNGYSLTAYRNDEPVLCGKIQDFEASSGQLRIDRELPDWFQSGIRYELASAEEAPLLAIRTALKLPMSESLPALTVRLGTTRGTNALLTRRGAKTAFITNTGFADLLKIGDQARPKLFELAIQKSEPLYECVAEIDARLNDMGEPITEFDVNKVSATLSEVKSQGVESVAICLLHAYRNDQHERQLEELAHQIGFDEVSISSRVAPAIKIVPRAETTMVDAYLNPVLREYVKSIAGQIPDGGHALKLMTSAGGLVASERFSGKDSVLSGPAGGVVGFAHAAEQEGYSRAIGFDMGGTSTDVARYGGEYEYEFETRKAGVRLSVPTLAIETVAAGGGSVCGFDGVRMFVGPESAGADPGPACYGKGGPLSVTDINLELGLILPEWFPFPLDREAVTRLLEERCEEVAASPLGRRMKPSELAEGYRRIAVETMVRAIRNVSVTKGDDPADHLLVCFGGAGPQHACAVARALGMKEILIHPYAGVLSAYGIGLADVRRFGEWTVLRELTEQSLEEVRQRFELVSQELYEEVRAEGIPEDNIQPGSLMLDLRYSGAETTLTVTVISDVTEVRQSFEELHETQFGYRREGRAIEIVAARAEVIGKTDAVGTTPSTNADGTLKKSGETIATFNGQEMAVPVYDREGLPLGGEIAGPAILHDAASTIIIEPDFSATVTSNNNLLLKQQETSTKQHSQHEEANADPVMLELFNNRFSSIAEQMGEVLRRTAFSTNVKERLDFSCAIFSTDGELVANAPHVPVHLGAMSETVKRVIADNPEISPGDVFVTNDPNRGGSHLPDVTVITPVFDAAQSRRLFWTASRAHHAEIGGIVPGSVPPFSKNLAEEGVLIRNFRLMEGGQSKEAELRELLSSGVYPSRNVDENLADIAAQVAANRRGSQGLLQLVGEFSAEHVLRYMQFIRDAAAEKVRLALRDLGDGEYAMTDHLDDGSPIAVAITIEEGSATVDFTGTGPVIKEGNLNANRAIVTAAVLYVFRCLLNEDIPLNGGVLEPVEIVLPECLLNPPSFDDPQECAAVVGGNVETSQRVVDVLLGALGLAAASQGTMNNLTFGDDTFGYYETICGGSGATADTDGADAVHTHMTNTRLTDPEVIEHRYPIRLRSFRIREESGGTGQQSGGSGVVRELEFLKPLHVAMLSERRGDYQPFGLEGGKPGDLGRNTLIRSDGEVTDLGGKFQKRVEAGDVLRIETPGGGGYGN